MSILLLLLLLLWRLFLFFVDLMLLLSKSENVCPFGFLDGDDGGDAASKLFDGGQEEEEDFAPGDDDDDIMMNNASPGKTLLLSPNNLFKGMVGSKQSTYLVLTLSSSLLVCFVVLDFCGSA
jgi:hypothetical protein